MKRLQILAVVVILSAVAFLAGFVQGSDGRRQGFEDDLQAFCEQTLGEVPTEIPERLIVDVTDEWNRTLQGGMRSVVESALGDALAAFPFSGRILARFEPGAVEAGDRDHVMGLVVERGRRLELMGLSGRHCSNLVLVSFKGDVEALSLLLTHELGHFFGLYHEWWDATYMGYSWCPGTLAKRFNARQLEILDRWNHPGEAYVPHWEVEKPGPCPALLVGEIVVIGVFLAVVSVVAVMLLRRARRTKDQEAGGPSDRAEREPPIS